MDVFSFTSGATAAPPLTLQLAAPTGAVSCRIEYGMTGTLGSSTPDVPVANGACTVTAPQTTQYWRHAYVGGTGEVISRGNIQRRGV